MKRNKYNNSHFFSQYSQMPCSIEDLKGAGEWHVLQRMLPDFAGKRALDLDCGSGWHCAYAIEYGTTRITGVDIPEKMLGEVQRRNPSPLIEYQHMAIEDFDFQPDSYDMVTSSLTSHYLESFIDICRKINHCLTLGDAFVFSVGHPIFTAYDNQDWYYDQEGDPIHRPVDRYFTEGKRTAVFLGEEVVKYHKTLTTYISDLLRTGFEIYELIEPQPDEKLLDTTPGTKDELRCPTMLLISAKKKSEVAK